MLSASPLALELRDALLDSCVDSGGAVGALSRLNSPHPAPATEISAHANTSRAPRARGD